MINLKKLIKSKKGISPLIATVLLVVVAVVLITIVMAWGKKFQRDALDTTDGVIDSACMGAAINISECSFDRDTNKATFLLENIGDLTFSSGDAFYATLIPNSGSIDSQIELSGIIDSDGFTAGEIARVEVTPTAFDFNNSSITYVDVVVRSKDCPNDAVARQKECRVG